MPATDIVQLVHSAVERNREIPAMLDAYCEFVDSPIGQLELQNLEEVFKQILDNLSQRYPDVASKRAATAARNDIGMFLALANNNADRVKDILRAELRDVADTFVVSIAERFTKMNSEERRAIDASLRLVRRSPVEFLFRVEKGKQLSSSGTEFEKYFMSIRSQAPGIKEIRYENLVVEKAIFNKLLLKSKDGDYYIWVSSFFTKERTDALIEKLAVPSEHLMLSRLKELEAQGKIDQLRSLFELLGENLGVLPKSQKIPEMLADFFQKSGDYLVLAPRELDDIFTFLEEEKEKERAKKRLEEEKSLLEEEARKTEQQRRSEEMRQKLRSTSVEVPMDSSKTRAITGNSIYLGKQLDVSQLISAIGRRVQEKYLHTEVKVVGEYFAELDSVKKNGLVIVGSSGSGRSTTLKRLLDGIGGKPAVPKMIVVDQKGEHRGIAWKYGWKAFGFASDSQIQEYRSSIFSNSADSPELIADLIQEWLLQSGTNCSDEQRERIASLIRAQGANLDELWELVTKEPDLTQLGQKLKRGLSNKSVYGRIFAAQSTELPKESFLVDISGRGLRDPTTREERQMISVLLVRDLISTGVQDSIIVLEDILDRFKSESLKQRMIKMIAELRAHGNSIIATSRSQVREFTGKDSVEVMHRLSGEKTINEELAGFESDISSQSLSRIVGFLPRGYAITSRVNLPDGKAIPSAAVEIEPLQFTTVKP